MSLALGDNSNNGYITHGNLAAINGATALTVAFWIWGGAAVSAGNINKGALRFFEMDSNRFYMVREVSIWDLISDGNAVPIEIWSHWCLVYNGTNPATSRLTLYKDGAEVTLTHAGVIPQGTNAVSTAPTSLTDTSPAAIEMCHGNQTGRMGHVRLWTAALTPAEVALEVHRYWAARQTDLLLDAPYNDDLDPRDYSGQGNHGTWDRLGGTPVIAQGPPVSYGGKVLVTG